MTKFKIKFAPGSFDDFDGSQEELDDLIKTITDFIQSDEFVEALENADEFDYDSDEDENLMDIFKSSGSHTIH